MNYTFFVIDDDDACRRMLAQIIEKEGLGEVVGERPDGREETVAQVMQTLPDIILVDLLMPGEDGIEVVRHLKERDFSGKAVMISQVEDKDMIAQAYEAGVEFFITKPINRIEVLSVLRRVIESLEMQRSFARVRDSLINLDELSKLTQKQDGIRSDQKKLIRKKTQNVLAELGIIGEPGSHDLVEIILFLYSVPDAESYLGEYRRLKDLYRIVQEKYEREKLQAVEVKAIEQRIRRAIRHALENIVSLGLEDYYNPLFEKYANKFFDFVEVRRRMHEEGSRETEGRVRVNIKQFINALYMEVQSR